MTKHRIIIYQHDLSNPDTKFTIGIIQHYVVVDDMLKERIRHNIEILNENEWTIYSYKPSTKRCVLSCHRPITLYVDIPSKTLMFKHLKYKIKILN